MKRPLLSPLLLPVLFSLSTSCAVAQTVDEPGDYYFDLGKVAIATYTVTWLRELCDEQVPDTREANRHAEDAWRQRNAALLADVEKQFDLIDRMPNPTPDPPESAGRAGAYMRGELQSRRTVEQDKFRAQGAATLRTVCTQYPALMTQPKLDFEQVYAAQMANLRKGPR